MAPPQSAPPRLGEATPSQLAARAAHAHATALRARALAAEQEAARLHALADVAFRAVARLGRQLHEGGNSS
jgi:hypothetical protein